MRVETQDRRVRDLVHGIVTEVEEQGGYVHPGLVVRHQGPTLSTSLARQWNPNGERGASRDGPAPDAPPLAIIPAGLFVPIEDLTWTAESGRLRYSGAASALTSAQGRLLDAMVELFNRCDKVATTGRSHPLRVLPRTPGLWGVVLEGRPGLRGAASRWAAVDEVVRSRMLRASGDETAGAAGVFMPVLDMMNHHPYGSRYERTGAGGDWLVRVHHPTQSDEVFLRYNRADSFGVALGLGYCERATRFVSSVPCTVDLEEVGPVVVAGLETRSRRLPVPTISRRHEGLSMGGLTLERGARRRIVPILALPLRAPPWQLPAPAAESTALRLLRSVVLANEAYFERLVSAAESPARGADPNVEAVHATFAGVGRHQLALLSQIEV